MKVGKLEKIGCPAIAMLLVFGMVTVGMPVAEAEMGADQESESLTESVSTHLENMNIEDVEILTADLVPISVTVTVATGTWCWTRIILPIGTLCEPSVAVPTGRTYGAFGKYYTWWDVQVSMKVTQSKMHGAIIEPGKGGQWPDGGGTAVGAFTAVVISGQIYASEIGNSISFAGSTIPLNLPVEGVGFYSGTSLTVPIPDT